MKCDICGVETSNFRGMISHKRQVHPVEHYTQRAVELERDAKLYRQLAENSRKGNR